MPGEDWSGGLRGRRGEGGFFGGGGRRGEKGERATGFSGRGGRWDVGAEVTPPSVGIVFDAQVLMHVPFWLPKMSEK